MNEEEEKMESFTMKFISHKMLNKGKGVSLARVNLTDSYRTVVSHTSIKYLLREKGLKFFLNDSPGHSHSKLKNYSTSILAYLITSVF